jgi:hypothetical protein
MVASYGKTLAATACEVPLYTENAVAVCLQQHKIILRYLEQKEWLSTFDNRTRDSHLAMAGKVANIDETFEVENENGGIDNMLYPLDPNGSAGNVVNCRCTILPVIQL